MFLSKITKTCRACLIEKSVSEFYVHPKMADGHLNKCKNCVKARVTKHRNSNLERIRAYDLERSRKREFLPTSRFIEYKKDHPERWLARLAVQRARRKGLIKRHPCWVCGNPKSQGHHPDYSRPLDLVWLCAAHHKQVHVMAAALGAE